MFAVTWVTVVQLQHAVVIASKRLLCHHYYYYYYQYIEWPCNNNANALLFSILMCALF